MCASSTAPAFQEGVEHLKSVHGLTVETWIPPNDSSEANAHQIAQYLRRAGYTVYAVNPEIQEVDGQPSYPSLKDVPEPIDIVDVFRRSEYLAGVVDDAIAVGAKSVWAQLGVRSDEAARKAESAALPLVMDACIKVEHRRLLG